MRRLSLLLALLFSPLATPGAQTSPPPLGPGRVIVTIRDTVHGDSLIRGSACTIVGRGPVYLSRCAPERAGRRFVIADLPPGGYDVTAGCEPEHGLVTVAVGSRRVQVVDSTPVAITIDVALRGCDTRPMRRVTGVMRAAYFSGFEEGRLTPCRPAEWFVDTDRGRSIWLEARDASVWQHVRWPKPAKLYVPGDSGRRVELEGYGTYYVELHGTLEGPGHYGHLGIAEYHFISDSVLSVRTPSPRDCGR
jgi:hypothetical protein